MSLNGESKDNELKSMELTDDKLENVTGGIRSANFRCRGCGTELTGDNKMNGYDGEVSCYCGCMYVITRSEVIQVNGPLHGQDRVLTDVKWSIWG